MRSPEGTSQTEHVFQQLRADLLTCRIAPGERLKTADLCVRLDVSLGAVREALSRLVADGLVMNAPQRGFRAMPISPAHLVDLTGARIDIEMLCLHRSLQHGDLRWESGVLAAVHELNHTAHHPRGETRMVSDDWSAAHARFHEALVAACDSPILLQIRRQLYDQSERYRRLSLPLAETDRDLVREHSALAAAAVARDVSRTDALIADHLHVTTRILLDALAQNPART